VSDFGRIKESLVDLWETRSRMPETKVEETKADEVPANA